MSLAKNCSSSLCDFEGLDATMMQCPDCGRKIRCRYCYSTTGAHREGCYRLRYPLKRGERPHYNHKTPKQVFNAAEVEEIPRPTVLVCKHKGEKVDVETCERCVFCKECGSFLGDIDCIIHGI